MAAHRGNPVVTNALRCTTLPLLLTAMACALDERELQRSNRSSDDQITTRDDTTATTDDTDEPSNVAATEIAWVDGCADLDTDGVADCMATLVTTPSFASDVMGWTASDGTQLAWASKNAADEETSGSAKLSGQITTLRAVQCVPIAGKNVVIAYANAFVETESKASGGARALLEVSYFSRDDCSGDSEGLFETPPSSVVNEWTTVQAGGISTSTTQSVSITLIAVKADAAVDDVVYFDNVMLAREEP